MGLVLRAIGYLDKKGDRIFDANGGLGSDCLNIVARGLKLDEFLVLKNTVPPSHRINVIRRVTAERRCSLYI